MKMSNRTTLFKGDLRQGDRRGQAAVEFALIFPILLVIIVGLIEVGRAIFIYGSVVTASREAARYGSAAGVIASGSDYFRYQDCDGIVAAAEDVTFLTNPDSLAITIAYDAGEGNESLGYSDICDDSDGTDDGIDADVDVTPIETTDPTTGDTIYIPKRIVVTVSTLYEPLVSVVPNLTSFTMETTSARTFLGVVEYWPE